MKKLYVFLLCLMVLSPIMLVLTGCGATETYDIEVMTSDVRYGSVTGNGSFKDGTTAVIKAVEKNSNFLCWALDNKVVSSEKEYSFQVTKNTKGKYVAIFDEGCDYYVLTQAEITIFDEINASELDFTVETGSSLSSLQPLCQTHTTPPVIVQNSTFVTGFHTGYILLNNYDDQYSCKVTATTTFDDNKNTYEGFVKLDLNKLATDKYLKTAETRISNFGKVSLTFEQLNATLIETMLKKQS